MPSASKIMLLKISASTSARPAITLILVASLAAAPLLPGCHANCRAPRAALPASARAGKTPRETIQNYIIYKEAAEAAKHNAPETQNARAQLFTARANDGIKKIAELEKEKITEETLNNNEAKILTKKQYYEFDAKTGVIARAGEYAEFQYKLRKEDNAWKIDNIATRIRSGDEYGGFVPKWQAGRPDGFLDALQ